MNNTHHIKSPKSPKNHIININKNNSPKNQINNKNSKTNFSSKVVDINNINSNKLVDSINSDIGLYFKKSINKDLSNLNKNNNDVVNVNNNKNSSNNISDNNNYNNFSNNNNFNEKYIIDRNFHERCLNNNSSNGFNKLNYSNFDSFKIQSIFKQDNMYANKDNNNNNSNIKSNYKEGTDNLFNVDMKLKINKIADDLFFITSKEGTQSIENSIILKSYFNYFLYCFCACCLKNHKNLLFKTEINKVYSFLSITNFNYYLINQYNNKFFSYKTSK